MNIKEIKEAIKYLPDDTNISFQMSSGCCGDYEELDVYDIESGSAKEGSYLIFRFEALPGYETCRKAGATKK